MSELFEQLNLENTEALKRRLGGLCFTGKKSLKKQELINLIDNLLQTEKLKEYWRKLDDIEQKVIAEVIFNTNGNFSDSQFFAKYQKRPQFSQEVKNRYSFHPDFNLLGSFFFRNYMPEDLCDRFKSFVVPPKKALLTGSNELPVTSDLQTRNMEISALTEIKAILRLIDTQKLKVSDTTRYPSSSAMEVVEKKVLYDGDFYSEENQKMAFSEQSYYQKIGYIRSFSWLMLIQAGKLASLSGGCLKLTPAGRRALMRPAAEILKELWEAWLDTNILDEFRRIDVIKGQTGKGKRDFTDVSIRRDVIQTALGYAAPNVWILFDDFSRFMLAENLTFGITKCDPWRLYICDQQYGSLGYADCHNWNILQKRYLLCFLFEFAATLGLIDVAYISPYQTRRDYGSLWGTDDLSFLSRYDGLLYFRINELGRFCLGLEQNYSDFQPTDSNINIQINIDGEITLDSSNIPSNVAIILEQFCKRQNNGGWLLDRESLVASLELGYELSQLRSLFSQYNVFLPQDIKELIDDIESKCNQIKIKGRVVLFECASPDLSKQLAGDSKINSYCSLVGEKLLAVPEEKLSKFQEAIKKYGYVVRK